jgi:hypothetical protein
VRVRIWDTVQREVIGTMRSIEYDVRRRFRRWTNRSDDAYPEYAAYMRRPRRALVGGGIAGLAVIGVAGTYFALAGGLGGWLLGSNISAPNPIGPSGAPAVTGAAHAPAPRPSPTPSPGPSATVTAAGGGRFNGGSGRIAAGTGAEPPTHRATSSPSASVTTTPTNPAPAPSPTTPPPVTPTDPPTSTDPSPSDSPTPTVTDSGPDGSGAAVRKIAGAERGGWSSSTITTTGA